MPLFSGLSAFPITPTDEAGRVDVDTLQHLLIRLCDAGVDSIGLLGSTGSYPYLARAERRRAIAAAVEAVRSDVALLVGIGALRTDDSCRLARDAKDAGADGLLLAPVSYIPLTEDEVFEHYRSVAAATDLPLCIYHNPATTHFVFSHALLGRLSRLPTIVAAKNPSLPVPELTAFHQTLAAQVDRDFSLGYSVDWHATEALIAGGKAWYSVAAGLFPTPCVAIVRAVQAGDHAQARHLDTALQPLWDLFREFSSYRVIHTAASALGLANAAPPRPILPLAGEPYERLIATLNRLPLGVPLD